MDPCGCARWHRGSELALVGMNVDFHGRIAPGVVDLTSYDLCNAHDYYLDNIVTVIRIPWPLIRTILVWAGVALADKNGYFDSLCLEIFLMLFRQPGLYLGPHLVPDLVSHFWANKNNARELSKR